VAAQLAGLVTNTGYLGSMNGTDRFSYKTADGKKIIYGTPNADTIDPSSAELTVDVYTNYQMVGGSGNDTISGSLLFSDELWGGDDNDVLQGRGGDDTLRGGSGDDVAVFRGDCLDYDIVRNGDGSITVNHVRGSIFGADDDTDTLFDMESARFSDGKQLDLTLSEIHGCTELGFLRDFVTGTTQDTRVVFDMSRRGDTSYPIQVFVDGRVTTGNAVFNDFFYTLPAGENPQLIIGASVAEVFGDVAFDFEIDVSVVSPLKQLVMFSDATAVDVTPICGPVPMRAGGVIKPPSIAGGLPGAYAPGEPNAVCMYCIPSCVALPIPLLLTTMRKSRYSRIHP
jgi:hypothetical protein